MATAVTMTGAEFDQLPDDDERKWELIDGELIEVPSPTARHQRIVNILGASLENYFERHASGAVIPDVDFALGDKTRLRPDVAVLLSDRWNSVDPDKAPIPVPPNIAVEIISRGERSNKSSRKLWIYLGAGVQEVWQVYFETSKVLVYRGAKSISAFDPDESITTPLLPEWSLQIRKLFKP